VYVWSSISQRTHSIAMAKDDFERKDDIYSSKLKAGKRTYYFDVKETRNGEYYLTMAEVMKKTDGNGHSSLIRHKIFLYKEDFNAFANGLQDAIDYVRNAKGEDYGTEGRVYDEEWHDEPKPEQAQPESEPKKPKGYSSDFSFDDL